MIRLSNNQSKMKLLIKICDYLSPQIQDFVRNYYTHYCPKYETDSGLDLIIPDNVTIPAKSGTSTPIKLGICCFPVTDQPHGYYLYPRSSLVKTPLRMSNSVGIIDYSYTGEIIACVDNISDSDYHIQVRDNEHGNLIHVVKLFQLVSPDLKPIQFELVHQLPETQRGDGAFGSTN